jgi:DNA (cytosine-5)-methyltransferase 1
MTVTSDGMRVLSVCSGIGAPECAWSPIGWRFVAHAEIEPFPSAVLAQHYPGVPNRGDMTKFAEWPDADVDVLVGGTPCQSFSVAGLRKGLADPRWNLALTFLAIADRFRPDWVVWENVPGVLSSGGGRDFGAFLGGLGQLGYGWAYRVLDAQYWGLAQRRKRVFVVASAQGWASAAAVLFERESLSGHPAPSRETGEAVAGTFAGGARGGGEYSEDDIPHVAHCLNAKGGAGRIDGESETFVAAYAPALSASNPYGDHESRDGLLVAHTLRAEGFDASEDGTGRGTPLVPVTYRTSGNCGAWATGATTDALTTATDPNHHVVAFSCKDHGADAGDMAPTLRAMGHSGSHANAGGQVAVANYGVYPTLSANKGGTLTQIPPINCGTAVRRLLPVECEKLQGFPPGYTDIVYRGKRAADGPRYRALGNSMAVPVVRWIGERIQMVHELMNEAAA